MFISSLFNKIKGEGTVTLILRRVDNNLQYFMVAGSIGYTVVTSGPFEGEMDQPIVSLSLSMDTVTPLMDKGYKFRLVYHHGSLMFKSLDENVSIVPLYVEALDDRTQHTLKQFLAFDSLLEKQGRKEHMLKTVQEVEAELKSEESNLSRMRILADVGESEEAEEMDLDGGIIMDYVPVSNPWGSVEQSNKQEQRAKLLEYIDKLQKHIDGLRTQLEGLHNSLQTLEESVPIAERLHPVDLAAFGKIISVAAKSHEFVSLCGTFAAVSLKECHLVQKGDCPVKGVPGTLMNNLLRAGGDFYTRDAGIVYNLWESNGTTRVFIDPYLPGSKVDLSLITRGALLERYDVDVKTVVSLSTVVLNKYDKCTIDMNTGTFHMTSKYDEQMNVKLDIKKAETRAILAATKDPKLLGSVDMSMAVFSIPKEVVKLLGLFTNGLTIYIKERKVVFEGDKLFLIFGRKGE